MQIQLSVAIITYNEEKNIGRCLDSVVAVADEIVVVDSFSTDSTEEICRAKGVRFIQHAFEGYIEQKNWATQQVSYKHVLSLDADECLSNDLTNSIQQIKNNWEFDAYSLNRLTNYCGKWIHHCGWYPDRKTRLFKTGCGVWGGTNPHDKFIAVPGAKIKHLKGDLLHYSYYTQDEHLLQTEKFSTIAAMELYKKGKQSDGFKIFYKTFARFFKTFILKLGFLEGAAGVAICRFSAYGTYLKYFKLRELNRSGRANKK